MSHPLSTPPADDVARSNLKRLLQRAVRRQRVLTALTGAVWGLVASAAIGLILLVCHRLLSPAWAIETLLWSVVGAGPLVGAIANLLVRRRRPIHAALEIERNYRLHERFSSILLLPSGTAPEAEQALLHDGEVHVERIDLKRAIPFRRPAGSWSAAVLVGIVLISYFTLPTFDLMGAEEQRDRTAEQAKRVEERKKQLEKRLAKLRDVARKEPISPETRRLLEKLQQRKERDGAADPKRQKKRALAELSRMRSEVRDRRQSVEKRLEGLEKMTEQIRRTSTPPKTEEARNLAKALESGDLKAASEMMKKMAEKLAQAQAGALDPKEAEALRKDMQRLMKKLENESLNKELAEQLKKMDAASLAELSKMADGMAGAMSDLARLMRERDLLDSAMGEIEFTEDELASLPQEWPEGGEP